MSATPECDDNGFCRVPQSNGNTPNQEAKVVGSTTTGAQDDVKVVKVQITSDNICPWCFIGKRRLEKAVKKLDPSKVKVEVEWRPFYLDPTLPEKSVNKIERYNKRFGADRVAAMVPHMQATGRAEGIEFSYGGKVGNTTNSHRLVYYAQRFNKVDEMIEKLFSFYFEQEKDIADLDILEQAGNEVGLPNVRQFLESGEGTQEIKKEVQQAYSRGISGVPHFVFDDRYAIPGAQSPEAFLQVFKKLGVY